MKGRILNKQDGRASVIALLSCAGMFFFVRMGNQLVTRFFGENANPAIYYGALAILSVMALFSLGCALHLKLLGNKSSKVIYRELDQRVRRYESLVNETRDQMAVYEEIMIRRPGSTTRRSVDCLGYARKVVQALDRRMTEVRELMSTRTELDLIDAYDIFRRKLTVNESSLNSLIDADPVPALDPMDWEPTIRRLIAQIDNDMKSLAA